MKPSNQFPKLETFKESVEPLSRNCNPNLIQNEHVRATCCRQEVAGDVNSSENVTTVEGYDVLNFEFASFISFWDIPKKSFRDGGGHRR